MNFVAARDEPSKKLEFHLTKRVEFILGVAVITVGWAIALLVVFPEALDAFGVALSGGAPPGTFRSMAGQVATFGVVLAGIMTGVLLVVGLINILGFVYSLLIMTIAAWWDHINEI